MRILFFGDVVGGTGRRALIESLPGLRQRLRCDVVIANAENAAGGVGITEKTATPLYGAGVDLISLGNHAYRRREAYEYLDSEPRIVRPANYPTANPGRGHVVAEIAGRRIGLLNLSGGVGLTVARSPFIAVETELAEMQRKGAEVIIVDFHAEVTSEKLAMGWHLDGRVGAVLGTHTHVPTADARVLPGGTALICDVGMTGARDSILGVRVEQALESFRTQMPPRFDSADQNPWVNAVCVEVDDRGLAVSIESIVEPAAGNVSATKSGP